MADISLGGKIVLGLIWFSLVRSCVPAGPVTFDSQGAPALFATKITTFDTPRAGLRWFAAATALAWSPDGKRLAMAADGNIFVREISSGATQQIPVHNAGDSDVLVFVSDSLLVTPGVAITSAMQVWDLRQNKWVADVPGIADRYPQLNRARQAALSPDLHHIATNSGGPGKLAIYDASDWRLTAKLELPTGAAAMSYAPDNHTLAVATFPAVIALFDAEGAKQFREFGVPGTPSLEEVRARTDQLIADRRAGLPGMDIRISAPQAIAFRPDGEALFVGAGIMGLGEKVEEEGKAAARVLRLPDGAALAVLDASPPLSQAAWEPHGRFVVFADRAKHVFVWKPGQSYLRITCPDPVRALAISPDGHQLAVGTPNGATIYRIDEK